jgi:adenine-specific DNA methylase
MSTPTYPKRLIEVDLPIKKISEHARREKSIRHGHISTLHIWWARRPLAACRAVICAALWPDPADPLCPESFKAEAKKQMAQFWNQMDKSARNVDDPLELRKALLDFIADFSNWDNSIKEQYLTTARKLTQSAHEALGGEPGTRPLVVDPFAGGGSIPLEALRVGADAYASDLNPVAVLLNKVELEYIPKYGQELADEVRKWGLWVKDEAEKELIDYYPMDPDGSTPIAYIWARTIISEAPGESDVPIEIPLLSSMWLARKNERSQALRWVRDEKGNVQTKIVEKIFADGQSLCVRQPILEIFSPKNINDIEPGTSRGGAATCPVTGYTTSVENIRKQLHKRTGGTSDSRLVCVVTTHHGKSGRNYRIPSIADIDSISKSTVRFDKKILDYMGTEINLPTGKLNHLRGFFNIVLYGMTRWGDLFAPRQGLALTTLIRHFRNLRQKLIPIYGEDFTNAILSCLAIAIDRQVDSLSSCTRWQPSRETNSNTFGRQALPMVWDYVEPVPISDSAGSFGNALEWIITVIEANICIKNPGQTEKASATAHPLPDNIADAIITDPPYYAAIPYADLSDFFYSWLRISLQDVHPSLFKEELSPKEDECVSLSHRAAMYRHKDSTWFESKMAQACNEGRRIDKPTGIGVYVFANKETSGWEAMLSALISSGWVVTASWPIDTEMGSRLRARNSATLTSSIHLVCRPRENLDGTIHEEIGEWSDVLSELPLRIQEWMPRLTQENVVGADAIFACLGPALEIFSRYSRVEKASGEQATLKEYLEKVWEAVENEALKVIFEGADASGFEEDARLTAMWLWTLKAGTNGESSSQSAPADDVDSDDDSDETTKVTILKNTGYALEYDAARKISQGLGIHPEEMSTLIEVKKGNARLLSVAERAQYLFGKQELAPKRKLKKREAQLTLFSEGATVEETATSSLGELTSIGKTNLDRVHQSMLLFGNGQSEELKRFLVDERVGKDQQFKKLAQALVALYPTGTEEKRWAEGVMSRMKGLGL